MTPKTASALSSPRFVTVMVGSLISELRSVPARARPTTSPRAVMSSASGRWSVSRIAGATRPPWRSETATPMWIALEGRYVAVDEVAVELGEVAKRERRRLEEQRGEDDAALDRDARVALLEPADGAVDVEILREVVVRDLALRARHRGGDGFAHRGGRGVVACGVGGRGGRRGRGRAEPTGAMRGRCRSRARRRRG